MNLELTWLGRVLSVRVPEEETVSNYSATTVAREWVGVDMYDAGNSKRPCTAKGTAVISTRVADGGADRNG